MTAKGARGDVGAICWSSPLGLVRIKAEHEAGEQHLKALTMVKSYIVGYDSINWPTMQPRVSVQLPGRYRFPNRDALEHFCTAVETESGSPAKMQVGLRNTYTREVIDVDEVFKLTSGTIYIMSITTPKGGLVIDNRKRRTQTTISALATTPEATREAEQLVWQAQRYLEPVPVWRRLMRTPVVTAVPAAEKRDNRWKMTVGLVSSLLGAVAGFVAGLVGGGLIGPN